MTSWGSKRVKEKTWGDSNVTPPLSQQLHSRGYCEKAVNWRHMIKLTFVKQKHEKRQDLQLTITHWCHFSTQNQLQNQQNGANHVCCLPLQCWWWAWRWRVWRWTSLGMGSSSCHARMTSRMAFLWVGHPAKPTTLYRNTLNYSKNPKCAHLDM